MSIGDYVSVGILPKPAQLTFTRQPFNKTVAKAGETVTFAVTAIGAVYYAWFCDLGDPDLDISDWTMVSEEDVFTFTAAPAMDGYRFRAVAVAEDDSYAFSTIVTLTCTGLVEVTKTDDIVTIENGPVNIKSLKVDINAAQSGSGDPSPENVRPISGWSEIVVTVAPTSDPDDPDKVPYTISLGDDTVYGGVLDVTSGVLTITHKYQQILSSMITNNGKLSDSSLYLGVVGTLSDKKVGVDNFICNEFKVVPSERGDWTARGRANGVNVEFGFPYDGIGVTDALTGAQMLPYARTWVDNNPLYICYELATAQTITLDPLTINTIFGENNIYADCGDITVTYEDWPAEESDQDDLLGLSIQPLDPLDTLQPSVLDPDVIDMLDLQPLDTEPEAEIDTDI